MEQKIGRQDIASALGAEISATPEIIPSKFGQPYFEIPKYLGNLIKAVNGKKRANDFGKGDAALISDANGNPTFAELIVVDRLRGSGWDCVWYSAFNRKIIQSWPWDAMEPKRIDLPGKISERIEQIATIQQRLKNAPKPSCGGIPDVIAWRENDLLMIECKHAKEDCLRRTQEEWFHSALLAGLTINQLGIYEWKFKSN